VDETGHPVSASDLAGRVSVVNLALARCGEACLLTREQLRLMASRPGGDERVVLLATSTRPLLPENGRPADAEAPADSERVLLVDQAGRVRGVYNAKVPLEMADLRDDLDMLLSHSLPR
jgi:cytochrome oxidase Cu insertion factor (SCO1/SenC/PrrC family)